MEINSGAEVGSLGDWRWEGVVAVERWAEGGNEEVEGRGRSGVD